MKNRTYIILASIAFYILVVACEGTSPAPTPPPLKDVYATAQTRLNEMQTEVAVP